MEDKAGLRRNLLHHTFFSSHEKREKPANRTNLFIYVNFTYFLLIVLSSKVNIIHIKFQINMI